MSYKALYRKYRPETFDDMVGQKHIIKTLKNAIANNKVAHAYIFSGPRGTGKTTTAKILAKALNCTSENERPCNQCENCKAINDGSHPDIIEIDAASNNGVDEVRDLIDKVKYAPIQGKYKVYIIDEVHMMTAGAFNALLKTLEEPPEHVVFILATTDVHKVIPTVLSRCQRFDFSKISFDDIKERIVYVLNQENVTFDDKVPTLIAELADGGMRDALSILDQVLSYAGSNIELQHIYDIYGMMSNKDMVEYLTLLAEGKTKEVLEMIETFIGRGIDVKRLTYDLMVCLKDAIVFRSTSDESLLERINSQYAKQLLLKYSTNDALNATNILNEARNNYRLSTNYRLFFEIASLKIIDVISANPNTFNDKEVVKQEPVASLEKAVEVKKEEPKEEIKVEKKEEKEVVKEEVKEQPKPSNKYEAPQDSEIISYPLDEYVNILCQGDKKFKEELSAKWPSIRQYINNPDKRYVAQLISDATIGVASREFIMLVYDFKLLAARAKQKNNIILIKKFVQETFGFDLEVYVVERATFIDITNRFFELRQARKLPVFHKIPRLEINQKEVKKVVEEDETIELGKELFGDDLIIE